MLQVLVCMCFYALFLSQVKGKRVKDAQLFFSHGALVE